MNDPWGSFQNFMSNFLRQLVTNPEQYMISRGISRNIANDPDAIIQKMMQEGKISQQLYNSARQAAGRIQSNPMFMQMLGGMKKV